MIKIIVGSGVFLLVFCVIYFVLQNHVLKKEKNGNDGSTMAPRESKKKIGGYMTEIWSAEDE